MDGRGETIVQFGNWPACAEASSGKQLTTCCAAHGSVVSQIDLHERSRVSARIELAAAFRSLYSFASSAPLRDA